jgi:hypothetical protein
MMGIQSQRDEVALSFSCEVLRAEGLNGRKSVASRVQILDQEYLGSKP